MFHTSIYNEKTVNSTDISDFSCITGEKTPDQSFEESCDKYMDEDLPTHLEKVRAATKLLPAWFVPRMMDDVWHFGLMCANGITFGISRIDRVSQNVNGNIWIDVILLEQDLGQSSINIVTALTPERLNMSINARHIIAAFEIAYT